MELTSNQRSLPSEPSRHGAACALVLLAVLATCVARAAAQCPGNWSQPQPMLAPTGRVAHDMAFDSARGMTVLFGGFDGNVLYDETWEWDGTSWAKRIPITMPSPRNLHAMAYDIAHAVTVLFGGLTNDADAATT